MRHGFATFLHVKELTELVHVYQSYHKKTMWVFFESQCSGPDAGAEFTHTACNMIIHSEQPQATGYQTYVQGVQMLHRAHSRLFYS